MINNNMVGVHKRRETFVSTADNNHYDDNGNEFPKSYCPSCESFGFYYLLKERLYSQEERVNGQIPRDSDSWLQCHVCGLVVATVHAKQESSIIGIKDIPDSIHDTRKLYVEHFIKPRSAIVRKNIKRINRTSPEEEDKDLQTFLDNGRQLTNYYSSAD